MDMVEKVAEAIWQGEWARAGMEAQRKVPWSEVAAPDQARYRFVAIAAIEALREPTKEMCEFAEDNFDRNGDPIAVCHRAMIEAILKSTRETA